MCALIGSSTISSISLLRFSQQFFVQTSVQHHTRRERLSTSENLFGSAPSQPTTPGEPGHAAFLKNLELFQKGKYPLLSDEEVENLQNRSTKKAHLNPTG